MPNIRIKDIPTTASATSSTDFIAIDGATNGTRKLSADSPVFSGNLTAGGIITLTSLSRSSLSGPLKVNNRNVAGDPTSLGDLQIFSSATTESGLGGLEWKADPTSNGYGFRTLPVFNGVSTYNLYTQARSNSATWTTRTVLTQGGNLLIGGTTDITGSGGLKVFGTTASTSTTTGALQVAGGVGVGGAITAGGAVKSVVTGAGAFHDSDGDNGFTSGFRIFSAASVKWHITGAGQTAGNLFTIGTSTSLTASTPHLSITHTTGIVSVLATTASTSTTTGALQVAGGVGVAGAIVAALNISAGGVNPVVAYSSGGSFYGSGANPQVRLVATSTGGWAFSTYTNVSATGNWSAGLQATGQTYRITNDIDLNGTPALSIAPTTLATTLGGTVSTSAPTGGAGAWKLGVANTVTPTLPNRTITIEIGGTVFYLHAKTTND
jgi:hypothetical protein